MSNLSTLPKGDSAWLLRKAIERIIQQVSVLETNIGSSTTGNSANTQVIFNDNGTLRGDPDLTFNTALNKLVATNLESTTTLVVGTTATITGALTVDTTTLKVDSTNHRVGVGTATPAYILDILGASPRLHIRDNGLGFSLIDIDNNGGTLYVGRENSTGSGGLSGVPYAGIMYLQGGYPLVFGTNFTERYRIGSTGISTWSVAGTTAMTLDANGLGIGTTVYAAGTKFQVRTASNINLAVQSGTTNVTGIKLNAFNNAGSANIPLELNGSILSLKTGETERLQIDASGNVGIGVTPSAWRTSVPFKALQIGYTGAVYALGATEQVNLSSNYLQDTAGNEVRIQAGYATRYQQSSGQHLWSTAASSTAGSGITFTQAMTLDASGNLLVGTVTAPAGTKVGAIAKLGGVSLEGTAQINVSTTPVALAKDLGTGGLFFVTGYNTTGGAQGWWLVASQQAVAPTVIASNNTTGLTVAFTLVLGIVYMNTTSGTIAVNSFAVTN